MNSKQLKLLLPENSGLDGIRGLKEIGYPEIDVVTNSLFNHLDHKAFPSSDIENEVAEILRGSGEYLEDKVLATLMADNKPQRKLALLKEILPYWKQSELIGLSPGIYSFVGGYDFFGLDVYAIKLMVEKKLEGHTEIEKWVTLKKEIYESRLAILSTLENV